MLRLPTGSPGIADTQPTQPQAMLQQTLWRLRWLSAAGQALAIAVAQWGIGIELPLWPMLTGVGLLLLANLWLHFVPAVRGAALGWLLFDTVVLAWQLYWSGGPANPFVSLLMVPIALAAVLLPARAVLLSALVSVGAYSLLWIEHHALPHVHGEFDLHLIGMWVNFLLSATVIAFFGARVARTLAAQREALAEARERSLRDEGLLAVASLAAGAAHALNTPLSTMAVVLADLRELLRDHPAAEDLDLLGRQLDASRQAVRELVSEAQADGSAPAAEPLSARLARAVTRWRLLRPSFELVQRIEPAAATRTACLDRGFDYLLINLLNNAADAAQREGARRIELAVGLHGEWLRIEVRDPGRGPDGPPRLFASSKQDGLGLGLALAELICERHQGRLRLARDAHGTCVRAELALPA